MEDLSEDKSNSMSDSSVSAGSSYYYYSGGDRYEYDEDSKIEKEIIQDQKIISGQKIDEEYESTLNIVDTREANISSAKLLQTHKKKKIQEAKTEPEKEYKCKKCMRSYKHHDSLYNHQKFECGVTTHFVCKFCDKRFKLKRSMNAHIVRVHQLPISNQKKQKILESKETHIFDRHQKTNLNTSQAIHFCDVCPKAYSSLRGLYHHKRLKHAAVKPEFICDLCGYITYMKSNLSNHISARHFKNLSISQPSYNCDKCFRSYSSLSNLKQHERLEHAAVKPQFLCYVCGYKASKKSSLSEHITYRHFKNSEASQVKHKCNECSKSYTWLRSLRRHKRLNHAAIKPL